MDVSPHMVASAEQEIIELYRQTDMLIGKRDAALLALDVEKAWQYDQQIEALLDALDFYQKLMPAIPNIRQQH